MTEIGFPGQPPTDRAGDADNGAETLHGLVRDHATAVLAVCLAHTKRTHDAEDLMQETFIKAFDGLAGLRDRDKARPWLVQIARRVCIDHLRGRKPAGPIPDGLPASTETHDPRIDRLQSVLAGLPDDYREIVTLYYLDGRDCAGVAAALGITPGAVRMRLLRARVMLYDLLAGEDK